MTVSKGRLWVPYSSMCSWAVEPGWAARSSSAVEGVPACTGALTVSWLSRAACSTGKDCNRFIRARRW